VVDTLAAGGLVERWLIEVEAEMRLSVRASVAQAVASYTSASPAARVAWIAQWPGQTVLAASQVCLTFDAHTHARE
jgi:dynein heavy chain